MKTVKNMPLVSVVMPVYNAELFLREAIDSIVAQTYKNWELILVNDNSTDSSLKLIKSYKKRYGKKIKVINLTNNLNKGGDAAANIGILKAKGKYIAKMDADDVAFPKRLELQVKFLQSNPDILLVGSQAEVINGKSQVVGEKLVPTNPVKIYQEYFNFHPIIHPTIMFRNEGVSKRGFYNIKYPLGNDYFTLFTLVCKGKKIANLPQKLLYYRMYGGNSSLKNIRKAYKSTLAIKFSVAKKYGYKINLTNYAKTLMELMAVFLLPQRVSFYAYLLAKGIVKKEELIAELKHDLYTKLTVFKNNLNLSPLKWVLVLVIRTIGF